jgi:hypothetical protein
MPTDVLISTILRLIVFQAPLIIIASVGLWFALSRKQYLARVSMLAACGFGLLIVSSLGSFTSTVIIQLQIDAARPPFAAGETVFWLSLLRSMTYPLLLVGVSLISVAVFLDRNVGEKDSSG